MVIIVCMKGLLHTWHHAEFWGYNDEPDRDSPHFTVRGRGGPVSKLTTVMWPPQKEAAGRVGKPLTQPQVWMAPAETSACGHGGACCRQARAPQPPVWVHMCTCHRFWGREARCPSQPCVPSPGPAPCKQWVFWSVHLSVSFSVGLTEILSLWHSLKARFKSSS